MSFSVMYSTRVKIMFMVLLSVYIHNRQAGPLNLTVGKPALQFGHAMQVLGSLVERRSRNPMMQVQISLETTNFSWFSAVSD